MKATVRGSMLRPVIKRVPPSLPERKLRAIEIGHAQARHDASSRVNKCPMDGHTLSDSELFQQLRENGVSQLGEIEGAYLEADGALTVFKAKVPRPGLPIVPPWEIEPPEELRPGEVSEPVACRQCGTIGGSDSHACSYCGHDK